MFTRLGDRLLPLPGRATAAPRLRMGSMPFDAWYSPLVLLGVGDLGTHRYRTGVWPSPPGDETGRGILYGDRSGFLDLAHLRNAIDLTRFAYEPIDAALRRGDRTVTLMSAEPDVFHVHLADGSALQDRDRRAVARAVAARVAYLMTTWHEVATWHGYKGMGLITERPSAFSYDDAASHMVGVSAATDALRADPELKNFDREATAALRRELIGLEVAEPEAARPQAEAVAGRWYADQQPRLRVIHMGLADEPLWARTLSDADPARWSFASGQRVAGRRVDDWYRARIDLRLHERGAILAAAGRDGGPDGEAWIDPARDFPALRSAMLRDASR